jgi:hypothetical protein
MYEYITRYQISCLDFVYNIKTLVLEHRHAQSLGAKEHVTVREYAGYKDIIFI